MDNPYLPILLVIIWGGFFAGLFLFLSSIIKPRKISKVATKYAVYECGLNPVGTARERIDVRFSVVAMLFILFDIETVFFFPWAILFKDFIADGMGFFMLIEMLLFVGILALGYIFIWRKGALDWK